MPRTPVAVAVLLLLGTNSAAAQAEPVSVPARDGLSLHGTLYRASGRAPLVLMFHQCNRSGPETGYEGLGRRLALAGMHAFALDSRGFGGSVNARYSDFRSRGDETAAHWPARVLHEERIPEGKRWRVRLVRSAPDGSVWLGTDAGYLLKLTVVGEAGPEMRKE